MRESNHPRLPPSSEKHNLHDYNPLEKIHFPQQIQRLGSKGKVKFRLEALEQGARGAGK
jgi:hypothetical protein